MRLHTIVTRQPSNADNSINLVRNNLRWLATINLVDGYMVKQMGAQRALAGGNARSFTRTF